MIPYNQQFLVFDTETEGLNLLYSRPWQISWILADQNEILTEDDLYIDLPDFDLSPKVRALTHFNEEHYNREKLPPLEVYNRFAADLYNEKFLIVGQNLLGFDIFIFDILARLAGRPLDHSYVDRIYDTRPLCLAHKEGLKGPRGGRMIDWQFKVLNDRSLKAKVSQGVLLKFFNIDHNPVFLHDAAYDIKMTWEIFKRVKKSLDL